ncbi:MAG TPA: hypothetical protein VJT75_08345 [Thermoleophilaceae bacterium]|nr:hypothetical protein [Thermoleophilaceae bacterium]
MRRLLYVALGIVALLVLSQLLVPPYLEHRAEKRLTEKGGHANVDIDAVPALRLLFDDGKRIEVRGDGLHVEILNGPNSRRVFDELDRFEEADVRLVRMSAGPFAVRSVRLTRNGPEDPYSVVISASVTARALSAYAGKELAGPFGALVGRLAGGTLPFSSERIPVEVDADIRSRDGRPEIVSVDGSVLGLSAGPLASAIASAIASRL